MAEAKRNTLKKVDGEKMAVGVYDAKFTDGRQFVADIRDLPKVDAEGKPTGEKFGADYDALPPMVKRTLSYGLKQKLDDAQAGCETIDEAYSELESTWQAIVAGNWTIRVAGEGVEGGLFQRAYAEVKGVSLADAKGAIEKLVAKNMTANLQAAKTEEEKAKITERRVFNSIRDAMLARNEDLAAKYKELQEKRKARPKDSGLVIDTSEE